MTANAAVPAFRVHELCKDAAKILFGWWHGEANALRAQVLIQSVDVLNCETQFDRPRATGDCPTCSGTGEIEAGGESG